jgi:hypothetical protein
VQSHHVVQHYFSESGVGEMEKRKGEGETLNMVDRCCNVHREVAVEGWRLC